VTLQRLVLDFRGEELVVRCLYRSQNGPNPGSKARRREVEDLAESGLTQALKALEDDAERVGTTREDVLLATASSDSDNSVKGA
jgi:hypothetical protein